MRACVRSRPPTRAERSGLAGVVAFYVVLRGALGASLAARAVVAPVPGLLALGVPGRAAEYLVLDPGQRILEDRSQVTERVLANGLGIPRGPAQVPGEIDGQPLQVAQQPGVEARGTRPAAPAARPRAPGGPVLPVLRRGPVRPGGKPGVVSERR